jgi:uncharacterized membrane protein YdjX (TVP38/TMEM64 family)
MPERMPTTRGSRRWILGGLFVLLGLVSLIISALFVDWRNWISVFRSQAEDWRNYVAERWWVSSAAYFGVYVLFAGLALPGAMLLTLIGGALFGWLWGVVLVSFASTAGATLAMLLSRWLLRDWVRQRYGHYLPTLQAELNRAGGWYLLSLRLNPVVPFFMINVAFGLTDIPVWRFWLLSQVGMLPATVLYVWAGTELETAIVTGQIVPARIILALLVISFLPILGRWLATRWLTTPRSTD